MLRVFGLATGFVLAVSTFVVVVFGVVVANGAAVVVVVLFVAGGATVPGVAAEPVVDKLPLVGVVDVVGAAAGSVVSGVGTGGNGFESTLAINSFMPAAESGFRNLYQVLRASVQSFFCVWYLASVPARATARAYESIIRSII